VGEVVILDYEAGNLRSVVNALSHLGCSHRVSREASAVEGAERVIFPGVGEAGSAMAIVERAGLAPALRAFVASGRPLLGLCLGSQIVFERSEEGGTRCIGLLPGIVRLHPGRDRAGGRLKVPHMGWNAVRQLRPHPIFDGIPDLTPFYFVHSYYIEAARPEDVLATCEYGLEMPSVVGAGSFVATQFHPEKSGEPGLRMLANFLAWDGRRPEGAGCS
jgi:glutamine amidotransferase